MSEDIRHVDAHATDSPAENLLAATRLFTDLASGWHRNVPAGPDAGSDPVGTFAAKALDLHATNFRLWHQEDAVRRSGIGDAEVSRRKRSIDALNAGRNAAIEDIDSSLLDQVNPAQTATLHTETPGAIIDRLSVLALRIVHTNGGDRSDERLAILKEQYDDLFCGLEQFFDRMQRGEIRFKRYRQFKSADDRNHCGLFET